MCSAPPGSGLLELLKPANTTNKKMTITEEVEMGGAFKPRQNVDHQVLVNYDYAMTFPRTHNDVGHKDPRRINIINRFFHRPPRNVKQQYGPDKIDNLLNHGPPPQPKLTASSRMCGAC